MPVAEKPKGAGQSAGAGQSGGSARLLGPMAPYDFAITHPPIS